MTRSVEYQVRAAVLGVTLGRGKCQCWEMGAQSIWGGHTEGGATKGHVAFVLEEWTQGEPQVNSTKREKMPGSWAPRSRTGCPVWLE